MRDEWRQGRTATLTQVLLLSIAALLSHLGWVAQPLVLRAQSSVCKLVFTLASCLRLISTAASTLSIFFLNVHLLPLFFGLFTQVHLLIDSSVAGQYITPTVLTLHATFNVIEYYIQFKRLTKLNKNAYKKITLDFVF